MGYLTGCCQNVVSIRGIYPISLRIFSFADANSLFRSFTYSSQTSIYIALYSIEFARSKAYTGIILDCRKKTATEAALHTGKKGYYSGKQQFKRLQGIRRPDEGDPSALNAGPRQDHECRRVQQTSGGQFL